MLISQIVKCKRAKEDDRPQICKSTQSGIFSKLARDHTISGNIDKIKRPAARYAGDLVACCLDGCGLGNSRCGRAMQEKSGAPVAQRPVQIGMCRSTWGGVRAENCGGKAGRSPGLQRERSLNRPSSKPEQKRVARWNNCLAVVWN